jgi:hypothetical protein
MKSLLRTTAGPVLAVLACLLPLLAGSLGIGFSGATLTSSSASRATVAAAGDWTPPTVAVTDPGAAVSGAAIVAATATDNVAVQSVRIQVSASGSGSWTDLCTDTTAPYTCPWATTAGADGAYELRAVATDTSGFTAASAVIGTQVVNTLRVVLTDPGDPLHGTVNVTATVYNAPKAALSSFVLEYATSGKSSWSTVCPAVLVNTVTCAWDTRLAGTGTVDLRATATVNGIKYTDTVTEVLVDNTAPVVSMVNPGSTLSGVATVAATASDADSGAASVTLRYAPAGSGTWTTLCTAVASPWSCRWDTTGLPVGRYDLQAAAVDAAGNSTTSSTLTVTIDNTVSSVSLDNPGSYVIGTVALAANAASTSGVASVRIQQRTSGSGTFSTICTTSVAPYTCSWSTAALPNRSYDLQAVLTDGRGGTLASSVVTVSVDNSPLKALDVQADKGSTIVGRVQSGDVLRLTYSTTVQAGSILSGWDGSVRAVTVSLVDNGTNDTLTFPGTNLGTVALGQNFVKKNKTITFAGTIAASTTTSGGVSRSVVTVTLGAQNGGGTVTTPAAGTMTWTPLVAVLSTAGLPCSTTPAVESGPADKDF